jgi:hypothetical protein
MQRMSSPDSGRTSRLADFLPRAAGHPAFPTSYRWGYGHSYRMSYPSAVRGGE